MSWETDFLRGVAQLLEDAGAGAYRSDGTAYLPGETAVVFGDLPPTPDRCIALNAYSAGDSANQNLSAPRLNVKLRGLPNDALDVSALGGDVFDALHGVTHVDLGDAHVVQMLRVSSLPFEIDSNKRHVRSDNYRSDVNTPTTSVRAE